MAISRYVGRVKREISADAAPHEPEKVYVGRVAVSRYVGRVAQAAVESEEQAA